MNKFQTMFFVDCFSANKVKAAFVFHVVVTCLYDIYWQNAWQQ